MPSRKVLKISPANLASKIADAIADRRIRQAKKLFDGHGKQIAALSPSRNGAADLLHVSAQWIDFDPLYLPLVEKALIKFRQIPCDSMTVRNSALVDMAEGIVNLHCEEYDRAIAYFDHAMAIADRYGISNLRVDARYHLARCHWKKGSYRVALNYIHKLKELNAGLDRPKVTAVAEMIEAWLYFLLKEFQKAEEVLKQAESELSAIDNSYERGNIASFWGRLARRRGEYDLAIEHFSRAISEYLQYSNLFKHIPVHRNAGRTHDNIAVTLILKARKLEDQPKGSLVEHEVKELRQEALQHLIDAESIYLDNPDRSHRGLGKVYNNRSWLYCDQGEFELAKSEATRAFNLGKEKNDHLVIGNTRITQSKIALLDGSRNVKRALELSGEALDHANQTENWRLQARAYIWRGEVFLEPPFTIYRAACECRDQAKKLLEAADNKDYLHVDFESLQREIERINFDKTVILYLERGEVLSRPLKEILKKVADEVIRYVYEDPEVGDGKVQRTAKLLMIAPKRVRESVNGYISSL